MAARDAYSTSKILNDVNIESWIVWENSIELVILCHDSHIALDEDEPDKPTDGTSPEEKAKCEKWERSNRWRLMIMRSKICRNIYLLDKSRTAKQMLAAFEEFILLNWPFSKSPQVFHRLFNTHSGVLSCSMNLMLYRPITLGA